MTAYENEIDPLVTCDDCDATSEDGGWGDTPLCLDCQRKDDADKVCEFHQRTFEDGACPLDHSPGSEAAEYDYDAAGGHA